MNKATVPVLSAIALLLVAILATLITIAWRGVRVEHTGAVSLEAMTGGIPLRMEGPVVLQSPEPVQMITTGATGEAVPISFTFLPCPECGGTLMPTSWNLWTGEIEWTCPTCDSLESP
jgi:hypothetical protein